MAMWLFLAERRVTAANRKALNGAGRCCLVCDGPLARLAERETVEPYHWKPCGWICAKCNTIHLDLSS